MTSVSAPGGPARALLALPDFRLFLVGRFLSTAAIMVQSVAVGWHIYDLTLDPLALGYVGLAQFLPMAALVLPAGSLADHMQRRRILVVSYLAQGVTAALLLALVLADVSVPWPFYATLVLFGTARAYAFPAVQAFLPQLMPKEQLATGVALNASTFQTAVIAGPALGGALFVLGADFAFSVSLGLFLGVAATFAAISVRTRPEPSDAELSPFARLAAGIAYMRKTPVVLGAISLDLFAVLLGGATALLPVYARDILYVGPTGLGLLRSAPAVGAAACALLLAVRPLARHNGVIMLVCVALFGAATIVFGLSKNFVLSLAALVVAGATDMISVYVRSTLIQLATPDRMRGRVSAVNMVFVGASNELGEFESGVTASWFGTVAAVVVGGVGTLIVVALWSHFFPDLRRVDRLADVTPDEEKAVPKAEPTPPALRAEKSKFQ
jgi:MFS family permease